jgi:hypothetical protein
LSAELVLFDANIFLLGGVASLYPVDVKPLYTNHFFDRLSIAIQRIIPLVKNIKNSLKTHVQEPIRLRHLAVTHYARPGPSPRPACGLAGNHANSQCRSSPRSDHPGAISIQNLAACELAAVRQPVCRPKSFLNLNPMIVIRNLMTLFTDGVIQIKMGEL